MYDVTTIGSATQDVYVFSKKFSVQADPSRESGMAEFFEFGTKIELDDIMFEVGGGGTNAAYTFATQGLRTACIARVGDDGAGTDVRKSLQQKKIKDLTITDAKRRTGRGIVFLGRSGERTILVYRGAAHAFKPSEIKPSYIKNTHWLYISSLAGNITLLEKIVRDANRQKTNVMINPGKREIVQHRVRLKKVLAKTDIVLLNREEASVLTGRAHGNIKGILHELVKHCPDSIILVTQGKKGFFAAVDNIQYRVIIKSEKGVDMTGAGDAFGSGFLSGLLRYRGDVLKALELAASNSAAVVKQIGPKHGLLKRGGARKRLTIKTF